MIKLFFRTLYPPLSHYLLLNNTQKTVVIKDNGRSDVYLVIKRPIYNY